MKTPAKRRRELVFAEARVRRATVLGPLLVLAIGTVVTAATFLSLKFANQFWIESRGQAEVAVAPSALPWLVSAIPIGFVVGVLLWDTINAFLIGPAPTRFSVEYTMASITSPGWFRLGAWIVLVLFTVVGALNVRKHARITDSSIREQHALAWKEQIYPYRSITSIELSRHWLTGSRGSKGSPSRQRALFVHFIDDKRWSLVDSELNEDEALNAELAVRIARHTNLPVLYPDTVVDKPNRIRSVPSSILPLIVLSLLLFFFRILGNRKKSQGRDRLG